MRRFSGNPDPDNPREIKRSGRIQDVEDGLSEMPHVILNQARVHDRYLELMRNAPARLEPDYGRKLLSLRIDETADYPVTVQLEQRGDAGHEGESEWEIQARLWLAVMGPAVSCAGAIGRELKGDRANQAWGVMDVLAVTDFPDYRMKTLIKSAGEGNIIFIPREGGHLMRVYIELDKLSKGQQLAIKDITDTQLIKAVTNRILHPYIAWM